MTDLLAKGPFERLLGSLHSISIDAQPRPIDEWLRTDEVGVPTNPHEFEGEYRETLQALARSDRVLEINTRIGLDLLIVQWWHDAGGQAVSFGSDAHTPAAVGHGFSEAAAMAEAIGFRPQTDPHAFWKQAADR